VNPSSIGRSAVAPSRGKRIADYGYTLNGRVALCAKLAAKSSTEHEEHARKKGTLDSKDSVFGDSEKDHPKARCPGQRILFLEEAHKFSSSRFSKKVAIKMDPISRSRIFASANSLNLSLTRVENARFSHTKQRSVGGDGATGKPAQ